MRTLRLVLAVAAGLFLATLPFLRYAHIGGPGEAHADHEPHYGGQLGMVGDHHVEVRRRQGKVEAFISDAWRRPIQPREGWVVFEGADTMPLMWESSRLVGRDRTEASQIEAVVVLADGTRLDVSFDFSAP